MFLFQGKKPTKDDQHKTPSSGRISRKIIQHPEEGSEGEGASPVKEEATTNYPAESDRYTKYRNIR